MSEQYTRDLLRVAVGQVCQTIGYNATQTSSLELLQDLLHRFLHEIARDLRRHVEHDNRTTATLEDVALTFSSLNLSAQELMDYVGNVEPVPFVIDVPKFPVNKPSNLNFLKPGSKEVLSRPVHIFEHLPPMLPPDVHPYTCETNGNALQNKALVSFGCKTEGEHGLPMNISEENKFTTKVKSESEKDLSKIDVNGTIKAPTSVPAIAGKPLQMSNDLGRPTREIMSVVMTTGGFISPAIEGKLPEAGIPSIVEKYFGLDAPPPPTPPPPPEPIPKVDVAAKSDKNILELKSTPNAGKEQTSSTMKRNSLLIDIKDTVNKIDVTGNAEKNISPKTNSSKQNMKKSPFVQSNSLAIHQAQQPMVALKLLKKAKKKNIGLGSNQVETMASNLAEASEQTSDKLNEKARRKRLKMIQKMLKNAQKHQDVNYLKKDSKKMKSLSNVDLFSEIPDGIERSRIEKMLKKQAKLKQKQLKKQMVLETQTKDFSDVMSAQTHADKGFLEAPAQSAECIAPKMEQKYDAKQTTLDSSQIESQTLLPNFDKVTNLPNTDHAQVECTSVSKNSNLEAQHILPSSEKFNTLEIKLSNEPDRNKLNIFKKISKAQKGAQTSTPAKQVMLSNSFTGTEGQIINLPSGTTITPAPLVFNPHQKISSQVGGLESNTEPGTLDLSTIAQPEMANKPKKRGRKPGSKNQPKILPLTGPINKDHVLNPTGVKKQKKKMLNTAKIDPPQDTLSLNITDAPGNFPKFDHPNFLAQIPFPNAASQIFTTPPLKTQRKERKEKENPKTLEVFPSDTDPGSEIHPGHISPGNLGGMPYNPLNMSMLFNAEPNIKPQQKPRKRPSNQSKNSNTSTMLSGILSGAQTQAGFPHLSSNLLSMLPFGFPPRPGLIPAPGLFPATAGLTSFSSQIPNSVSAAANAPNLLGLGSSFFPFPTIKSQTVPLQPQTQDQSSKECSKELPAVLSLPSDRSYCNVAPLVPPDSIKRVTEITETSNKSLLIPGKHQQKGNDFLGNIATNSSKLDIPGDKHNDLFSANSGIPYSPNVKHDLAFNSSLPKSTMTAAQSADKSPLALKNVDKYTPTGGADDPIEVSDESDETVPSVDSSRNHFSVITPPTLNALQLPASGLGASPVVHNPITQMDSAAVFADSQELDAKALTKEAKKLKKVQKHSKKNSKMVEFDSSLEAITGSSTNLSGTGSDGFSKLAGGADLIPLTGTGLAYSSKSIPSTSLTASRQMNINISTHETTLKESSGEPEKRYNDLTIIPNIQKKKNKEHKKLRKLKEGDGGKIKKKKDKKDKMKDKELLHLTLVQESTVEKREDREALKKLKKERKKEKQRLLANPNEPPQANTQSIPSNTQIAINMLSALSESSPLIPTKTSTVAAMPFPSALPESPVSSLVPKLTLKINSSQSPTPVSSKTDDDVLLHSISKREPSPELARFSPLVTRPPKQKIPQNDNQMTYTAHSSTENKSTLNVKPTDNVLAITPQTIIPPPNPWLSGGTLTANSVLLPQQLMTSSTAKPKMEQNVHSHMPSKTDTSSNANSNAIRSTNTVPSNNPNPVSLIAETNRPSSYVDAEGNTVWICPACGKVDDGSPMIGCDGCDAWYHWECVGICVAPNDNEDWFCRVCITRKKGFHSSGDGAEKKRKRSKKK